MLPARTLLTGLAVITAGCTHGGHARSPVVSDGERLPVLIEDRGAYCGATQPLRIVAYDSRTLRQLPVRMPGVDFDIQMVLFAAMGPAASAQCAIHIDHVWRDGDKLRVQVVEQYPESARRRQGGPSSPFHAVAVPRSDWPIVGFSANIPRRAFAR